MSDLISFSTNNFKKIKNVEIDGVHFKVRRFGAGEQLSVAQLKRKIEELSKLTNPTDEQQDEIISLSKKMIGMMEDLFDDMKDGSETHKLMQRIDMEDLALILEQIFREEENGTDAKELSES